MVGPPDRAWGALTKRTRTLKPTINLFSWKYNWLNSFSFTFLKKDLGQTQYFFSTPVTVMCTTLEMGWNNRVRTKRGEYYGYSYSLFCLGKNRSLWEQPTSTNLFFYDALDSNRHIHAFRLLKHSQTCRNYTCRSRRHLCLLLILIYYKVTFRREICRK